MEMESETYAPIIMKDKTHRNSNTETMQQYLQCRQVFESIKGSWLYTSDAVIIQGQKTNVLQFCEGTVVDTRDLVRPQHTERKYSTPNTVSCNISK